MMAQIEVRVIAPGVGEMAGLGGVRDRFMIDAADTGGRCAVVEHLFEPRAMAAPLHRHRDEDEWSYVLTGRLGAVIEGREVEVGPGHLLFKPRGQWHTFWNAGDEPASCLELISPAGLEDLFKSFAELTAPPEPEELSRMGVKYGVDVDFPATFPIVERHRLSF